MLTTLETRAAAIKFMGAAVPPVDQASFDEACGVGSSLSCDFASLFVPTDKFRINAQASLSRPTSSTGECASTSRRTTPKS